MFMSKPTYADMLVRRETVTFSVVIKVANPFWVNYHKINGCNQAQPRLIVRILPSEKALLTIKSSPSGNSH